LPVKVEPEEEVVEEVVSANNNNSLEHTKLRFQLHALPKKNIHCPEILGHDFDLRSIVQKSNRKKKQKRTNKQSSDCTTTEVRHTGEP